MSYRKREIAHWNEGKGYKGARKAKEHEYATSEIEEQLAEQHPDFRYKTYKRTPNKEARLEHSIEFYKRMIGEDTVETPSWRRSFLHYAQDSLKRAEQELKELREKKNVKVRS